MADESFTTPDETIWTCPPGLRRIYVECYGAGGGAAGGHINVTGGGGAGGAYAASWIDVIPGEGYQITVGLGGLLGNAGVALPGGIGGFSQFNPVDAIVGATVTAIGGAGAGGFVTNDAANPGLGTTDGSTGDIVIAGADGQPGSLSAGPGGAGGQGAGDLGGAGGAGGTSGSPTNDGQPYGGGGGGGWVLSDGGDGGSGAVFITYARIQPVVRLYPRDDGRGMSSAPRIWPRPKGTSRIIGGYR